MFDSKISNERLAEMQKLFGSGSLPNRNIEKTIIDDVVVEKIQEDITAVHPIHGKTFIGGVGTRWLGCVLWL